MPALMERGACAGVPQTFKKRRGPLIIGATHFTRSQYVREDYNGIRMGDCTCGGRNPNCIHCGGRGTMGNLGTRRVSSNMQEFRAELRSIAGRPSKQRRLSLPGRAPIVVDAAAFSKRTLQPTVVASAPPVSSVDSRSAKATRASQTSIPSAKCKYCNVMVKLSKLANHIDHRCPRSPSAIQRTKDLSRRTTETTSHAGRGKNGTGWRFLQGGLCNGG